MEFRVAREFLAWAFVKDELPTDKQAADRGGLWHGTVAKYRNGIVAKGGDIFRGDERPVGT
jgi:hypothetical protein